MKPRLTILKEKYNSILQELPWKYKDQNIIEHIVTFIIQTNLSLRCKHSRRHVDWEFINSYKVHSFPFTFKLFSKRSFHSYIGMHQYLDSIYPISKNYFINENVQLIANLLRECEVFEIKFRRDGIWFDHLFLDIFF